MQRGNSDAADSKYFTVTIDGEYMEHGDANGQMLIDSMNRVLRFSKGVIYELDDGAWKVKARLPFDVNHRTLSRIFMDRNDRCWLAQVIPQKNIYRVWRLRNEEWQSLNVITNQTRSSALQTQVWVEQDKWLVIAEVSTPKGAFENIELVFLLLCEGYIIALCYPFLVATHSILTTAF